MRRLQRWILAVAPFLIAGLMGAPLTAQCWECMSESSGTWSCSETAEHGGGSCEDNALANEPECELFGSCPEIIGSDATISHERFAAIGAEQTGEGRALELTSSLQSIREGVWVRRNCKGEVVAQQYAELALKHAKNNLKLITVKFSS